MNNKISLIVSVFVLTAFGLQAQQNKTNYKFEQLGTRLPTPNTYRTASGAPGHEYWQQRADYEIDVTLNDEDQSITGSEKITYTNGSPDELTYLWVQLDQNVRAQNSDTYKTRTSSINDRMSGNGLKRLIGHDYDLGYKINAVKDAKGSALSYTINQTMLRVDLPQPLKSGETFVFNIDWFYYIHDRIELGGRCGYEYFEEDGNYLYTIAQWFPRMAVYSDNEGWQNKQFLGRGEFTLPFGDYTVNITVPSDHIVASTGSLQNPDDVLTATQKDRFEKAKTSDKPVIIVTQTEAEKAEKSRANGTKTWVYKAENVRDFAWGSSRKYIWDAMGVDINGKNVMAMSYYPKEANPLYEQYSTEAVAHTLEVYSKFTIDYPYPVAISVEAANGMEYPMICFNYGRPEKDGTYSERIKYGMLGVIIHEVGHNFFPMIINSDERQWTWMDEGLNSFVQYLAQQEWQRDFPSRRGPAQKIIPYMKSPKETQVPIMTNSEQIIQFGNNAYGKPATALNILRETVMGRELFDYAFKVYSERWAFKHPTPADFFRTMEDASGVDLDWFWHGWFYTTDHVDIAIEDVKWYKIDSKDPRKENEWKREDYAVANYDIATERNKKDVPQTAVERNPNLNDFYNSYDRFEVSNRAVSSYQTFYASLSEEEKKIVSKDMNFYEIHFKNVGGLIMPLIIEFTYADGTKEVEHIPAEIWRLNNEKISKVFVKEKEVVNITLDPYLETADVDTENNYYPERNVPSRFELFKRNNGPRPNPMQLSEKKGKKKRGKNAGR